MDNKYAFIQQDMETIRSENRLISIRTMESAVGAWMVVDGRRVLNFCTNNYLGLANHPQLKSAAIAAVQQWGVGPAAVRTIAGTQRIHLDLEKKLAEFKEVSAALFVQSGFCANQAAIPPLVNNQDVIFSDRLNHASLIDGARLSGAKVILYEHRDAEDLKTKVRESLAQYRQGLVITDGVFSMDGDIAPLDKISAVAEEFGVLLMVDDAHGEGVLGQGKGIVHHFGLQGKVDVEIGTLSKAFGVVGGVIAGSTEIVEYIRQKARPNLFSSATTPADTAACLAAINLVSDSPDYVERLWKNTHYFQEKMRSLGYDLGNTQTPITPVMIGEVAAAREFSTRLFDRGVFAMALGFPTVPRGLARIRVMLSASHTKPDLDYGLEVFADVGQQLHIIKG